jgi:YidC/Oxa1 family membrane protein insertase
MEKRVFLAIFLSFLVLAVYQAYFAPHPPPGPPAKAVPSASSTGRAAASSSPAASSTTTTPAAPASASTSSAPVAREAAATTVADSAARDIVVDTNDVHAVFSTRGATLTSWKLKHYLDAAGQPLELVPSDLPATADVTLNNLQKTIGLVPPFTLGTDDASLSATLAAALYQPSIDHLTLGSRPGTLSFEYRNAAGLTARKTFHFQPEGKPYLVVVDAAVDVGGTAQPVTLHWGPALGLGYKPDGSRNVPARAVQYRNDRIDRLSASNLEKQAEYTGVMRFAGVEEQYFLSAALPGQQTVRVDYAPMTLPVPGDPKNRTRSFVAYSVSEPGAASLPFFMGPKVFDQLRAVDPELTRTIDFGFFAWLAVPLLQALKWINGYLGNYGWSIVALTVLINLAIFPLRHRSMVSMRKMQAVQPEVKAIQARYAKYKITDPERQKMNQEMMALYKQKGVNPASGCLPMLLTFPILFAFYSLLGSAIELRGAPFILWIHDLSLHDPYYITPVLMGVTMLVQQRMMPTTADPMQQKIFMVMPIVFTVTFLAVPSGLVIYWLMSNVMAIGQQYVTNRIIGAPARPVPPPKAARALKGKGNAGGGGS